MPGAYVRGILGCWGKRASHTWSGFALTDGVTDALLSFCPQLSRVILHRAQQTPRSKNIMTHFTDALDSSFKKILHFRPTHVTEQRDQGLCLLDINGE